MRATANCGRLDRRGGEARLMLRSGYRADGSGGVEVGAFVHERYVLHARLG